MTPVFPIPPAAPTADKGSSLACVRASLAGRYSQRTGASTPTASATGPASRCGGPSTISLCKLGAAAAVVASFSGAAHADSWSLHGWTVDLVAVEGQAHVAEVHAFNAVTPPVGDSADTLSVGGLSVALEILHTPCRAPDTLTVIAPEGFVAVPMFTDIPERESAMVRIFPNDAVGM